MKKLTFRSIVATLATCTAVAITGGGSAYAGNPNDLFQLDGNLTGGTVARPDWSDVFQGALPAKGATAKSLSGFTSPVFVSDFNVADTKDDTLFATGSKDTLNITPGWECKKTNNVSDKVDINNAYAVAYVNPGDNHLYVFFALDVSSNDGTKDVGFWFLKDPSVGCVANGSFTGNHSDGDVLIVSEFTNGGRVSSIVAYKWVGGADGFLDPNPIASGGECDGQAFNVCAKVNDVVLNGSGTGNGDQVPWLVKTKKSNPSSDAYNATTDLDIGEFFEGGIDLTAAGISGCFNRYLADTRSSTSLTATIFDYTLGNFANCSMGASKACVSTVVNTATSNYTSTFTVTLSNTSPSGVIFDVSFNEPANAIPAGETCEITTINGAGVTPIPIANGGTPVELASSLAAGASVTAGISCTGSANGFANVIHATAGSADGLADISKDATSLACPATVTGGFAISKVCKGMVLEASGSAITLKANVEITASNPGGSNENVQIDSLTDSKVTTGFTTCGTNTPVDPTTIVLAPGGSYCFAGSYTPTAADLNSQTAPSTAFFTDQATGHATGLIDGAGFPAQSAVVSCYLCDADVDGSPDVIDCLTDTHCNAPQ